jgi:tetratricopeptide (TPR) repeat protein
LNFFVDETLPHVYDTIANLYLSNNRLIEAESEIIKCLQIEAIEDDENTEHNFTAAKIYYKKNDLINGLKYYNKAIELGADNDLIKYFQEFLNDNELNV